MFFVTEMPVTFFLIALQKGDFYLFFIRSRIFFVTVLYEFIRMYANGDDMNKFGFIPSQEMTLAIDHASHADPDTVGRLIILVPADLDFNAATRRVWELANTTGMDIRLLGLCKDKVGELGLHRSMVTMSALIQDARISVETNIEIGTHWLDIVKRNYRKGDMIVCFAEQRIGLLNKPLSEIIQSHMESSVYILYGLYPQENHKNRFYSFLAWVGSFGIIIGSFLLQIRITSLAQDWAQTTLLIGSMITEFWLIWGWNSLLQ
jgi:hypothetical protein